MRRHPNILLGRSPYQVQDVAAMQENYNPLKTLTIKQAVYLYDCYRAGRFSQFQLTGDALEQFDDVHSTLVEKRQSALLELDYGITTDSALLERHPEWQQLANEQQAFSEDLLSHIDNMPEALSFLSLASFRGYSHLEIVTDTYNKTIELSPIEQWFWSRPMRGGEWLYNPMAIDGGSNLQSVDPRRIIVRECPRPINVVALFAIVKKAHAEAGLDGFIDVFGNPALFFEMPPETDDEQQKAYNEIMRELFGDGRGTFAHGGQIHAIESTMNNGDLFKMRVDMSNRAMVLAATGGILTVLTESGSGTLAGTAHQETFSQIAAKEGAEISNLLARQLFLPAMRRKFGNNVPVLARFQLSPAPDNSQDIDNITKLHQANIQVEEDQITELTGYRIKPHQNFDMSALYPTKSAGFRPTEAALERYLQTPLEPVPPELMGQDPATRAEGAVTNTEHPEGTVTNVESPDQKSKPDPLIDSLRDFLTPATPSQIAQTAGKLAPVLEEAAQNAREEAEQVHTPH